MKVYLISSGDYSDYHIDRVFLDKEKAERYVELAKHNSWDEPRIEEFETSDDKQIDPITFIEASYTKDSSYSKDTLNVEIKVTNSLDDTEEECNRNYFYKYHSGEKSLTIKRVLKNTYDEEKLKSKYEKVCCDLMAKIESLLDIEGWEVTMVQEWLGQNVDKYL